MSVVCIDNFIVSKDNYGCYCCYAENNRKGYFGTPLDAAKWIHEMSGHKYTVNQIVNKIVK